MVMKTSAVPNKTPRWQRLIAKLQTEPDFMMTSWNNCIAGIALRMYKVDPLTIRTGWEGLAEKFSQVMRLDLEVARALVLPPIENEILKYVPASHVIPVIHFAFSGATAPEVTRMWRKICYGS